MSLLNLNWGPIFFGDTKRPAAFLAIQILDALKLKFQFYSSNFVPGELEIQSFLSPVFCIVVKISETT